MTPDTMSALHKVAFRDERPWQADEFTDLLANPFVKVFVQPHGFAVTRTVAGESELLTLAVDPIHRRQGIARCLLNQWLVYLSAPDDTAFLEVAADNIAAITLYHHMGFTKIATRTAYYARKNSTPEDALIMRRGLTHRNAPE